MIGEGVRELGFAAGIMTAAAIWELIIPAMERGILPALVGIWGGMVIFLPAGRWIKGAFLLAAALLGMPGWMGLLAGSVLWALVEKVIPRMDGSVETVRFSVGFTLVMVLENCSL